MENAPSLSCLTFGIANIEAMKDISSGSCKASQSQNFELGSATECVDLVLRFPWCNTICTSFFFVKGQLTISDTSIIFNPWNSLRSSLYSCYSEGTSTNFRSWVPLFWSLFARQSMPQNERQDEFRVVNKSRTLICNLGEFISLVFKRLSIKPVSVEFESDWSDMALQDGDANVYISGQVKDI